MRQIWKNLLLATGTVMVCLVLLEMVFASFAPQAIWDECTRDHPDWPQPLVVKDEFLGWKTKANWEGCLRQPDTNEKILLTTNSLGLRGKQEYTLKKPDNTFRVVILGDSFIWGESLHDYQTPHVQLKKALEKKFKEEFKGTEKEPPTVEVIPFGVGGYGTTQSFINYLRKAKNYDADLVIYFFFQNDLDDSFFSDYDTYPRPAFTFIESNQSDLKDLIIYSAQSIAEKQRKEEGNQSLFPFFNNDNIKKWKDPPRFRTSILGKSHFFTFFNKALKQKAKKKDTELSRLFRKIAYVEKSVFEADLRTSSSLQARITLILPFFIEFQKEVTKKNSHFVVVNIPSGYQVKDRYRDTMTKLINEMKKNKGSMVKQPDIPLIKELFQGKGLYKIEKNIKDLEKNYFPRQPLERLNIPLIDLTFLAHKHQHTYYFKTDDHWSPYGVAVSAEYVANELAKREFLSFSNTSSLS